MPSHKASGFSGIPVDIFKQALASFQGRMHLQVNEILEGHFDCNQTLLMALVRQEGSGLLRDSGKKEMILYVTSTVYRLLERKRRENGRNVTSFRAWPLWPATWVGYELGGSVPHQCR